MYNHYLEQPRAIKEDAIARIDEETRLGIYDPMPELRRKIYIEARTYQRNMISTGLTTGFLAAVGLGVSLSLTAPLVVCIGGGLVLIFSAKGIGRFQAAKTDLRHDNIADYLTDEDLEDLDEFQLRFKPTTEQARLSHEFIKNLCDELLEEEGEEAIETRAEEVKETAPDLSIKTPNNLPDTPSVAEVDNALRTPNDADPSLYPASPWADAAKLSTANIQGNKVKKLTFTEDNFVDKVDNAVEESIKKQIDEYGLPQVDFTTEKLVDNYVELNKRLSVTEKENADLKLALKNIQSRLQTDSQPKDQPEVRADLKSFTRSPGADSGPLVGNLSVGLHGAEKTEIIVPDITINIEGEKSFTAEVDITGWTVDDFKKNVLPGTLLPEQVADAEIRKEAISKVFECQNKYDRTSPEFAVWYVFGMKRKTGDRRYEATAKFCKNVIDYWKKNVRGK